MGWESWPWNTAIVNDGTCTSQLYIYTYYIYIYDFEVFSFEGSTKNEPKKTGMNICGTKFQLKPTETDLQKQWKPPWKLRGLKGLELGHVRRQNLRKPPGCFFFFFGAWYSSVFRWHLRSQGTHEVGRVGRLIVLMMARGSLSLIIVIHPWICRGETFASV